MSADPSRHQLLGRITGASIRRPGLIIGFWVVVVLGLNTLVPSLEAVTAQDSTAFVPDSAPSLQAVSTMDQVFGNGKSRSFVSVVAERKGGLTPADTTYVQQLAATLAKDKENVTFVQDLSQPELRRSLTSKDGQAIYFQVGLPGYTGAPKAVVQVESIREAVKQDKPVGLTVLVTGASATVTDTVLAVDRDILILTIVTVAMISLILYVIYRSLTVTLLIMGIIGVALGAARGATALLGDHDLLAVSTLSGSFLTAVVLGATTDYAIFLISRFQEMRRDGVPAEEAALLASSRIGAVIAGSAMTVILANACLGLAHVGLFRTTGPPTAVSILLALGVSLTLAPALIALLGRRGLLDPVVRNRPNGWARVSRLVVTHPVRLLVGGLIPLAALAAFLPTLQPSYDERIVQPSNTESNRGYRVLDAHYPRNEVLPDFLLITADRDLRNPRDLAALERAAQAVAAVPGVQSVRSVTRPAGTTLTAASLATQAGKIGDELSDATKQIKAGSGQSAKLVDGAGQVNDGAVQLAQGAQKAAAGAEKLLGGVRGLESGLAKLAGGSAAATSGSAQLSAAARQLADGLDLAVDQTQLAVDALGTAYEALRTRSLTCSLDPACRAVRDGLKQLYEAQRDQLVPGLRRAADGARRIAGGAGDLRDGLRQISAGLDAAQAGTVRLADAQATLGSGLNELADGSGSLADGTGQVATGTEKLADSVTELGDGLSQAANYLSGAATTAAVPGGGGFYLPPSAFKDERFALASNAYLSPDGTVARLIVLGKTNAFGSEATARVPRLVDAAEGGLQGTRLASSTVAATGMAATNADLADLAASDFRLVAFAALLSVFLVLLFLIRSLVASLFLLASVVLSYAATMGISIIVFQELLGQPLEWTVACVAFVILVAVGADYNLLLIKRVHEEAPDGNREGIARAVRLTGGVITAAGVIFAGSMFALMSGTITTVVQLGFTAGVGLLLDTFVVRTLIVPAFAAVMGPRFWWPSAVPAQPEPAGAPAVQPTN